MTVRKHFLLTILFIFLLSISNNCFCQTISGVVLDSETKKPLMGANVYLTSRKVSKDTVGVCYHFAVDRNYFTDIYKFKIILETNTDSLGKFIFDSVKFGRYNIVASYKIKMPDSILFPGAFISKTSIDKKLNIDTVKLYLSKLYLNVVCEFEKTKNQKFCPICRRKDKVLPIIFGLPIPFFNEKGIEVADKHGRFFKDYYHAGCTPDIFCNPSKHCNRCNKDF
jgi:hypothetical protein